MWISGYLESDIGYKSHTGKLIFRWWITHRLVLQGILMELQTIRINTARLIPSIHPTACLLFTLLRNGFPNNWVNIAMAYRLGLWNVPVILYCLKMQNFICCFTTKVMHLWSQYAMNAWLKLGAMLCLNNKLCRSTSQFFMSYSLHGLRYVVFWRHFVCLYFFYVEIWHREETC